MQRVFPVALQHHHVLEIKNQIRTFIEGGEHGQRLLQFQRADAGIRIALGSGLRQLAEVNDFLRQNIADAGDGAGCAAIDEAVENGRIDADHQGYFIITAGDVLGRITHVGRAAEFLEADKVLVLGAQGKEEIGAGGKAVIGAVVDNRRDIRRSRQDGLEMRLLGGDDRTARQDTGNDHQALGANLLGVGGMCHGRSGVDRAGADDHRNAGLDQALHAFHALLVGEQRPVAHGTAINDSRHAIGNEFLALAHKRIEIRGAIRLAGGHQCGNHAGKNAGRHY
ncbi:hypothetical protein D3C80_1354530 [compost metagenome]